MLTFQQLTIDRIPVLQSYFAFAHNRACDNTAGAAFMWREYFHTEYAVYQDILLCKARLENGKTVFSFPLGQDYRAGLAAIDAYCIQEGITPAFCAITKSEVEILQEFFGDCAVESEKDWSDYLYHAEDFRTFAGRRLHGQRNHMNFFKRTYSNFSFEEISADNIASVKEFFKGLNLEKPSKVFLEEMCKTAEVLDNYALYGMLGGILRVEDRIVGFSAGERYGDTLYIHIEKADTAYRGAYQILLNQFVLRFGEGITFVNREDDAGDPGLRTSKLAYHPCELLEKFTLTVKR